MDFREEPVPFETDAHVWDTLRKTHINHNLARPQIDGKVVDMLMLLQMVHKSGGSATVSV